MRFKYDALNGLGQSQQGWVEANSLEQALEEIKSLELRPLEVEPVAPSLREQWAQLQPKGRISTDELILFSRQMQALTKAGLAVSQSILGLARSQDNPTFKTVLEDIGLKLNSGFDLTQAMSNHQAHFDELILSMIQVGETTGRLDQAFGQLVKHLEQEKRTKQQIKQATRYPLFVLLAMALALVVVSVFIIPQFSAVFSQLGAELPMPTRILLASSNFLRDFASLLLLLIASGLLALRQYYRTPEGHYRLDKALLGLWLVGPIVRRISLGRFTRPLAMMQDAGVPLLQSLSICALTVNNAYISRRVLAIRQHIEAGDNLITACQRTGLFNPVLLQMISVGEETGQLSDMLNSVSDFYEQEVDFDIQRLSQSIEPILLLFMTLLVAILALGVFLPMWDLYGNLSAS